MLGTFLIQLAVIASRADLESLLCNRVLKFMDALAGVVPYSPDIDFGDGDQELNGTGSNKSTMRVIEFCMDLGLIAREKENSEKEQKQKRNLQKRITQIKIYFSSNLRMSQNCTVDYPDRNKKTMNLPIIEDMVIFLNNGKWVSVNDCELNISINVEKEGDQVSMKTRLLEVPKIGNVSVDDSCCVDPKDLSVLKSSLNKTVSLLCENYLSSSFSSSSVVIDQGMAFALLQQVYKVFLTVL